MEDKVRNLPLSYYSSMPLSLRLRKQTPRRTKSLSQGYIESKAEYLSTPLWTLSSSVAGLSNGLE